MIKILLMGKVTLAKSAFAGLLLNNVVIEPPTMREANELLLKEAFAMVLYGVHTNADGSRILRKKVSGTEIVYVAEKFNCGGAL